MAYGQKQAEKSEQAGGKWFQPGVNPAQIKSWSIDESPNGGKVLKIVYQYPDPEVNQEDWKTVTEFINFPSSKTGELSEKAINRFENLLKAFFLNFVDKKEYFDRLDAVGTKYNFETISTDVETAQTQFEQVINACFNLVGKRLNIEGILICGYGAPKTGDDGETKQYVSSMKYGQDGVWKTAFRTDKTDTEMPAEKLSFTSEDDRKYNYWSYKKEDNKASETVTEQAKPAQTEDVQEW